MTDSTEDRKEYFRAVEEHFQACRGTAGFLFSTEDWQRLEDWECGGVPVVAVLRGIDEAFKDYKWRKLRGEQINSLWFCRRFVFRGWEKMKKHA